MCYGQVYLVTSDIIGREPTPQDEAALWQTAAAMLFLALVAGLALAQRLFAREVRS